MTTTTPTPAPAPMTARLRELMEEATPGPICESALVPLYAVQDYGYNEAVAAFAEFDDEGELTMQFQGDKAKATELLTKLAVMRPEVQRVLDRAKAVPVDIRPRFVTAEKLLSEHAAAPAAAGSSR